MKCPVCGGRVILSREFVCSNCGLVIETPLFYDEWEKPERIHHNVYLRSLKLNTTLDWKDKDYSGMRTRPFYKLRLLERQFKENENILELRNLISSIMCKLGYNLADEAFFLYLIHADKLKYRRHLDVAAGIVYACLRMRKIPISIEEVAAVSSAPQKSIKKIAKLLKVNPITAEELIILTGFDLQVKRLAIKLLRSCKLRGRSSRAYAAASLYLSAILQGRKVSQMQVAKICKTTDITLRNALRDLLSNLEISILL